MMISLYLFGTKSGKLALTRFLIVIFEIISYEVILSNYMVKKKDKNLFEKEL